MYKSTRKKWPLQQKMIRVHEKIINKMPTNVNKHFKRCVQPFQDQKIKNFKRIKKITYHRQGFWKINEVIGTQANAEKIN